MEETLIEIYVVPFMSQEWIAWTLFSIVFISTPCRHFHLSSPLYSNTIFAFADEHTNKPTLSDDTITVP